MKIKEGIDVQEFLKKVLTCQGDVFYDTVDGDHMNLKSQLSQFVFAILSTKEYNLLAGEIHVTNEKDIHLLLEFLSYCA